MSTITKLKGTGQRAVLVRNSSNENQIIGTLLMFDGSGQLLGTLRTLELADRGNEIANSCIPVGKYFVSEYHSMKFGQVFKVVDVPNREGILFHQGNFYYQSTGCILIGMDIAQIDADKFFDVRNSLGALFLMRQLMDGEFFLTIVDASIKQANTLVY